MGEIVSWFEELNNIITSLQTKRNVSLRPFKNIKISESPERGTA